MKRLVSVIHLLPNYLQQVFLLFNERKEKKEEDLQNVMQKKLTENMKNEF